MTRFFFFPSFLRIVGADTTPPMIVNCPTDITQPLAAGQTTVAVSWTEPTATDDTTPVNQIQRVSTHTPNQQFGEGSIMVIYLFIDQANNEARCTFNVMVTGKLIPQVVRGHSP